MRLRSLRRELGLGLAVYGVYLLVRWLVLRADGRARARRNAERLVALEERLGIHAEPALQRLVLRAPRAVHALNVGYGLFNVTLTVGWLIRLHRQGDPDYARLRRACVLAYLGAQPAFLLFPTEPPRGLEGFVDTMAEVSGLDLEHPFLVRLYNPVAALPSLHVAFAVLTGGAIAERADSRATRALARSYAPLVSLVVVATGNHYLVDVVAGAALGSAARRLA
ncbi:MAG: phosphatase PAP2 family protein [Gaiellaceae bacterium]|nr:phosphatase PAP2 family protein [Gaiellaceae bacterium]